MTVRKVVITRVTNACHFDSEGRRRAIVRFDIESQLMMPFFLVDLIVDF